jgi:hypothetical protein
VTPGPTPVATPPAPTSIAEVRALPDGATATIEGVVTLALGGIDGGRGGFVQDATGGLGLYLDAASATPVPAGTIVRLTGILDTRYSQRVLRGDGAAIETGGPTDLPEALPVVTGEAGEPNEGRRLRLGGTVTTSPSSLADGLGMTVDDGTGPVRVIVGEAALAGRVPVVGDLVDVSGPLGQRDSSGTGLQGYRLFAMLPGELAIAGQPSPTPAPTPTATSPSPSPTPEPSSTPSPSSTPAASPSATPVPTPGPTSTPAPSATAQPTVAPSPPAITDARVPGAGSRVVVRGVVVAEAGRLGTPALFAVADATGGLPVKLADGQVAPPRGTLVELRGLLADPYGQLELRLAADGLAVTGTAALPVPVPMTAGEASEATEGRLVRVRGTIIAGASRATSGDSVFTIEGTDGATLRVLADDSASVDTASLRTGTSVTLVGVVGQRASRKGALDGYRLWLRDPGDVTIEAVATPSPSASPSASAGGTPIPIVPIGRARSRDGQRVTVEGTITVDRSLLDASGRRTIVEDGTGAIELYLPAADPAIRAGVRARVSGTVGTAWGAPRLRVEAIRVIGRRDPVIHALRGVPGPAVEWELVRVTGTVDAVHRSGDRWTAELVEGSRRIPLVGLPGSGIQASALVEGRRVTVVGVVKRPYPTATDQRFAIVPRSGRDVVLAGGPAEPSGGPPAGAASPGASPAPSGAPGGTAPGPAGSPVPDVPLVELALHVGEVVRVGGLVVSIEPDRVRIDDGTAAAAIVLEGPASLLLDLVVPGDAINATGTPDERGEVVLVVTDPGGVVLLGELGGEPASTADAGTWEAIVRADDGVGRPAAAALAGAGRGADPAALAALTLVLIAAVGAGLAVRRTARARRLARARIQARLDALGAGVPAPTAAIPGARTETAGPG